MEAQCFFVLLLWYVLWLSVEALKQGMQRALAQWELLLDLTVDFVP
jgi:hypothetical protein